MAIIPVVLNTNNNINITFNNPVVNVTSTQFIANNQTCVITDSYTGINIANGQLALIGFNSSNSVNVLTTSIIGTLDHTTGTIVIPNLNINTYLNNQATLSFTATPANKVMYVYNNDVLDINLNTLNINVAND